MKIHTSILDSDETLFPTSSFQCIGLTEDHVSAFNAARGTPHLGAGLGLLVNLEAIESGAVDISATKYNWIALIGSEKIVLDEYQKIKESYPYYRILAILPPKSPRLLIPLDSLQSIRHGLRLHRPGRWQVRLALRIAKLMTFFGVSYPFKRSTILVAERQRIKAHAIYLGTPGPHSKINLLPIMRYPKHITKLAFAEESRKALRNEYQALKALENSQVNNFVPRVLLFNENDERSSLRQSYRQRISIPMQLERRFAVKFLAELSKVDRKEIGFKERFNEIAKSAPETVVSKALISSILFDAPTRILLHRNHGDFASWNSSYTRFGFFVYDWETSTAEDIALQDAFYYIFATAIHVDKNPNWRKYIHRSLKFANRIIVSAQLKIKVHIYFQLWLLSNLHTSPAMEEIAKSWLEHNRDIRNQLK